MGTTHVADWETERQSCKVTVLPTHPTGASVGAGARSHSEQGSAGSRGGKQERVPGTGTSEGGLCPPRPSGLPVLFEL